MIEKNLMELIKLSLWEKGNAVADRSVFNEMKQHAIASLAAKSISSLDLSMDLKNEWKKYIIQQLSFNAQCNYEQSKLSIRVPYVILKGTSAAQYYPYPEYRAMGDIDIMTRREDYDIACKQLVEDGYHIFNEIYKETNLSKNGISIDIHRQFASLNNPEHVRFLDDLIIENINSTHVLPDMINGLVLLDHINQHLENGLGLRQIIDWMMFVDKCLPDERWPEFFELVKRIGLEKLAIVCTRMCEMYLGLPHREWCGEADAALCKQLMDYIMACGNFGEKKELETSIGENVFMYARTPSSVFKLLQRQGLENWETAREHRFLRHFAWIYQLFRYTSRGLRREQAASKLKQEYVAAKKKNRMFDALGVKTAAKGLVIYKNGKYIKE